MRRWGLGVTASGYTRVPAKSAYPPKRHPEDHQFDWAHGRVLDALQVVLISSGGGWLETRVCKERRVEAGMVFLLLPGVWHRYRPDPGTGWEESWIEVQGPVVNELLKAKTFPEGSVLRAGAMDAGLDEVLDIIHQRARGGANGFDPEFSAAASTCESSTAPSTHHPHTWTASAPAASPQSAPWPSANSPSAWNPWNASSHASPSAASTNASSAFSPSKANP